MASHDGEERRVLNIREMNKNDTNSQANVVKSVEDEDDMFLATNDEVVKTKWVVESTISKNISRD